MLHLLAALCLNTPALAATLEVPPADAGGEQPGTGDQTPAQADFDVPDPPDAIELHMWARAGYEIRLSDADVEHGPYLGMARLKARLDHQDRYGVYMHISGDGGQLRILDAEAHATLAPGVKIAAGRMKAPISHDFGVPVERMLLPTRALLVRLAPNRAVGAQLTGTRELGHLGARARVALMDPLRVDVEDLGGAQLVLQGDLHWDNGLFLHGAGAVWIHEKAALERDGVEDVMNETLDVAVGFDDDDWTLHAEGLLARPLTDAGWEMGGTLMAGHRMEVDHEHHLTLEPVLAVDLRDLAEGSNVRGSAGINLHEDGWHLLQTLAYEVEHTTDQPLEHRIVVQIQAGL